MDVGWWGAGVGQGWGGGKVDPALVNLASELAGTRMKKLQLAVHNNNFFFFFFSFSHSFFHSFSLSPSPSSYYVFVSFFFFLKHPQE